MIILIPLSNTSIVFADEDLSSLHPVHYFMQSEGGGVNLVDKSEEIRKENYWVDLKYSKVYNVWILAASVPAIYINTYKF